MEKNFDDTALCCSQNIIHDEVVNAVKEKMLKDGEFTKLSMFFKAISDETRIKILYSLSQSNMCVCDIAALLGMTVSAISHQLRILKQAELVKSDRDGKVIYYSLNDDHVEIMLKNALVHISE